MVKNKEEEASIPAAPGVEMMSEPFSVLSNSAEKADHIYLQHLWFT